MILFQTIFRPRNIIILFLLIMLDFILYFFENFIHGFVFELIIHFIVFKLFILNFFNGSRPKHDLLLDFL